MVNSKIKLILASASPRRKELLGHLNIPFEIRTLNVPEISSETDPKKFTLAIAALKGEAVTSALLGERTGLSYLVVSADTIVCLDGKIFEKPCDRNEARKFLSQLAGRTHSVFTAVSVNLIHQNNVDGFSFVDESLVTFAPITQQLMENYLNTGDSLDKAGAYGIQGPSLTFISKVEGSYATVVGFPLSRFTQEIEKFLTQKFPLESSWFDLF